jgi:hypothetical protein
MRYIVLLAALSVLAHQSAGKCALTTNIIVQNEIVDNGQPLAITEAVVFVSESAGGSNTTTEQVTVNGRPVSNSNPLTSQSDALPLTTERGYKRAQLRYKVAGDNTRRFTGACAVTQGSANRDHYLQQAIIRPRTRDAQQTQFVIDEMKKPTSAMQSGESLTRRTVKLRNRMYSAVDVFLVGADLGIGMIYHLEGGATDTITGCPGGELAVGAFDSRNNSLQHLGCIPDGETQHDLIPNAAELCENESHKETESSNKVDYEKRNLDSADSSYQNSDSNN